MGCWHPAVLRRPKMKLLALEISKVGFSKTLHLQFVAVDLHHFIEKH